MLLDFTNVHVGGGPAYALSALGIDVPQDRGAWSPSQFNDFFDCERKWAFNWLWHIRGPSTPAAELGTEVHALLERWARYGTPPPRNTRAGKIALKMLGPLPPPGVGDPERRFYLRTRKHVYTGLIDWPYWMYGEGVTIIDHKTTSDLRWAKNVETLLQDPQANIYAAAGCTAFHVDSVRLLWNYGTTGSRPRSLPVSVRISLDHVVRYFQQKLEPAADRMHVLQQARTNPYDLPANIDSCEKYGGCPHRDRCELTNEEKLRAIMTQDEARANGGGLMANVAALDAYQHQPQPPQQPQGYYQPQGAPPGTVPQQPQQMPLPQQPQPQYGQPAGGQLPPPQGQPPAGYAQPQPPQGYAQQQPQYAQPQQQPMPQQPQHGFSQPQTGAYAPNGGAPSSPPNAPEAQTQNLNEHAAAQEQEQAETRKKGKPAKKTKTVTDEEKTAFMFGMQGAMMRGYTEVDHLHAAGVAAIQAFRKEFPSA